MEFEVRAGRGRPQGAKPLSAERAAYLRLMQQGYSNAEACRQVGVNDRTGRRWRNGQSASPGHVAMRPVKASAVPPVGRSRYLTEDERIHIADRWREKAGVRQIAAELGRSPSTISREVRRNANPDSGAYRPWAAQRRAEGRQPRPKPTKIATDPELRGHIAAGLGKKWSPQQICQALRKTFPDRPEWHVAHETIYQALYVQGRGQLRRELAAALRTGRPRKTLTWDTPTERLTTLLTT